MELFCSELFGQIHYSKLFGSTERMRAMTQGEGEWDLPNDDILKYAVRNYSYLLEMLRTDYMRLKAVHSNS